MYKGGLTASPGGCGSSGESLNAQPSTLNPQPSTLNPQPSTLNPSTHLQAQVHAAAAEGERAAGLLAQEQACTRALEERVRVLEAREAEQAALILV